METPLLNLTQDIEELNNKNSPSADMIESEFDELLCNIGTFLYLITKKSVSPSSFFLYIVGNKEIERIMMDFSGIDSRLYLYSQILLRYPNLTKSKMLKRKVTEIVNAQR